MAQAARWNGTAEELHDLVEAGRRNCGCRMGHGGSVLTLCPVHHMIRHDQRALDGLVFARRIAARLLREERSAAGAV